MELWCRFRIFVAFACAGSAVLIALDPAFERPFVPAYSAQQQLFGEEVDQAAPSHALALAAPASRSAAHSDAAVPVAPSPLVAPPPTVEQARTAQSRALSELVSSLAQRPSPSATPAPVGGLTTGQPSPAAPDLLTLLPPPTRTEQSVPVAVPVVHGPDATPVVYPARPPRGKRARRIPRVSSEMSEDAVVGAQAVRATARASQLPDAPAPEPVPADEPADEPAPAPAPATAAPSPPADLVSAICTRLYPDPPALGAGWSPTEAEPVMDIGASRAAH